MKQSHVQYVNKLRGLAQRPKMIDFVLYRIGQVPATALVQRIQPSIYSRDAPVQARGIRSRTLFVILLDSNGLAELLESVVANAVVGWVGGRGVAQLSRGAPCHKHLAHPQNGSAGGEVYSNKPQPTLVGGVELGDCLQSKRSRVSEGRGAQVVQASGLLHTQNLLFG